MRVAVTGATGFLGRALVERLLAERMDVHALARHSQAAADLEARGVQIIPGDLQDAAALARLVAQADLVYHLAAKVESPGTLAEFVETNVNGTERLLNACLAAGVRRVVYASSIAVYGIVHSGEPIDETTPFDSHPERRDFYAQSKILADRLVTSFSRRTGLPVTILRPGIIYGAGKPLPVALLGFRAGKTNVAFGNPSNRIPLIYIENLIDAMFSAAALDRAGLHQFNIVDDENLTLAAYHQARKSVDGTSAIFLPGWPVHFAASIVGVASRLSLIHRTALSAHQVARALQDRCYVTRHIREETGWQPKVPLLDSLRNSLHPKRA